MKNFGSCRRRSGIVLLVTLVLLVVLSTLAYTLTSRLSARRHRAQYMMDYQAARYGCDSAVKYALATLEDISPRLVNRPNEPDFSDLFYLSEAEYEQILTDWVEQKAAESGWASDSPYRMEHLRPFSDSGGFSGIYDMNDTNDINDVNDMNDSGYAPDSNDPNSLEIRGPYGPPWPLITKAAEFEVGPAKVKIEIEDENAKYPLGWMLMDQELVRREAVASFETFCEWMDMNDVHIASLEKELEEMAKIKPFRIRFKPIAQRAPRKPTRTRTRTISRRGGRKTASPRTTTVSVAQQVARQAADFSQLFHSSMIDTELLARPTIFTERRKESALKYAGIWGSTRVNINTAPRHVLEAVFTFGGDADRIAEEIIQRRRLKPFKDINELKQELFGFSDSIRKCEGYITTRSVLFTIRVTAVSGVAEASAVIAITKEGGKTHRIAVISG